MWDVDSVFAFREFVILNVFVKSDSTNSSNVLGIYREMKIYNNIPVKEIRPRLVILNKIIKLGLQYVTQRESRMNCDFAKLFQLFLYIKKNGSCCSIEKNIISKLFCENVTLLHCSQLGTMYVFEYYAQIYIFLYLRICLINVSMTIC